MPCSMCGPQSLAEVIPENTARRIPSTMYCPPHKKRRPNKNITLGQRDSTVGTAFILNVADPSSIPDIT